MYLSKLQKVIPDPSAYTSMTCMATTHSTYIFQAGSQCQTFTEERIVLTACTHACDNITYLTTNVDSMHVMLMIEG